MVKLDRKMPANMYIWNTGEDRFEIDVGAGIVRWKKKLMKKEKG